MKYHTTQNHWTKNLQLATKEEITLFEWLGLANKLIIALASNSIFIAVIRKFWHTRRPSRNLQSSAKKLVIRPFCFRETTKPATEIITDDAITPS